MKRFVAVAVLFLSLIVNSGNAFPQNWTAYTAAQGLPDNQVSCIAFDHTGVLWAATSLGLARYDGTATKVYTDADGFTFTAVNNIRIAPNDDVWITASRKKPDSSEEYDGGVARFSGGKWAFWTKENGLSSNNISSLAINSKGEVWIGHLRKGVQIIEDNGWRLYDLSNGLPNNDVGFLAFDLSDNLWMTIGQGFYRYKDGSWDLIYSGHPLKMAFTPDGAAWGGGYSGELLRYDGSIQTFGQLRGLWVTTIDITSGSDGTLWGSFVWYYHGYKYGVFQFDGAKWDIRGHGEMQYLSLATSPGGGVFAGTQGNGVMRVDQLPLGVNENKNIPRDFAIVSISPNPFNPSTTISFSIPNAGRAQLSVYSITGQKVRTLLSGPMTTGMHSAVWDGKNDAGKAVSSGIYIAHIQSGKTVSSHKMLLMK